MFAPRHERTAQEMARVCGGGGVIVTATWTPEGVFGDLSKAAAPYMPSPPDYASPPPLWGREDHVRELFGNVATSFEFERPRRAGLHHRCHAHDRRRDHRHLELSRDAWHRQQRYRGERRLRT